MATTIKTSISTQKKLSLAAGILSAIATFVSLICKTWGFEGVGEQMVTTFLAANTVINMYFFGSTGQKIAEDNKTTTEEVTTETTDATEETAVEKKDEETAVEKKDEETD